MLVIKIKNILVIQATLSVCINVKR